MTPIPGTLPSRAGRVYVRAGARIAEELGLGAKHGLPAARSAALRLKREAPASRMVRLAGKAKPRGSGEAGLRPQASDLDWRGDRPWAQAGYSSRPLVEFGPQGGFRGSRRGHLECQAGHAGSRQTPLDAQGGFVFA